MGSFTRLSVMMNSRYNLINNEGDILSIFHLEIARLPSRAGPGLLNYCDTENDTKDEILFRVTRDKKKLLAWSASARATAAQIFPIIPITQGDDIVGLEIKFDSENNARFVLMPEEPTYWPSEEVPELDMPQVVF